MKDEEFNFLVRRSEKTELQIMNWYKEKVDSNAHKSNPGCKQYDIVCPKVNNIEVKEDLMATDTGFYAIEVEDAQGEPSGISATTAGEFVLVDQEFVVFLKTTSLLFMIKECCDKRMVRMGYTAKEGKRAIGYLIPRQYVLSSPYSNVEKRWFPWR